MATKKRKIARKANKKKTTPKKTVKSASSKRGKKVAKKALKPQSVLAPEKSVELKETPVASYEIVETRVYEEFVDRDEEEPGDKSGAA